MMNTPYQNNNVIRNAMKRGNISQWQLADEIGVSESTIGKWFRYELTGEKHSIVVDGLNRILSRKKASFLLTPDPIKPIYPEGSDFI